VVIAVYAPSDATAPFVREADLAIALRGSTAAETYLDIPQLLAAAQATDADAVHPGYGFLSERSTFARAVIDAGLTWVGPPPAVIDMMGDKLSAKALMAAAGVPVLPTLQLGISDDLTNLPADLPLPLIVKPSAGGGGKGMHIVNDSRELTGTLATARREAAAYFGDGTVFVEPYVPDARHVEIQVLADEHGHVVHCFERDCSIQRRHQKVIEEAPSPALDETLRRSMGAAAVAAAIATGYRGAGTVEFVVDGQGEFWFLEVNTRLQVEHAVTEAVTGLDLVREQLHIASGLPLSFGQDQLAIEGHAIEARVYAEDPAAGFLPATGTLYEWSPPIEPAARWDSGVETGSIVGPEWDPMLAKVIAHAPTRTEAALRLALALKRLRVRGVNTNRDFLVEALGHPEFLAGRATTNFTERDDVRLARVPTVDDVIVAATAATLVGQVTRHGEMRRLGSLPSRWHTGVLPSPSTAFAIGDRRVTASYELRRDGDYDFCFTWDTDTPEGKTSESIPGVARIHGWSAGLLDFELNGKRIATYVATNHDTWWVQTEQGDIALIELPRLPTSEVAEVPGGLRSPMPGTVLAVFAAPGHAVSAGAVLMIVEAMKMEHRIVAPASGTVTEVKVAVGDQVEAGTVLAVIGEPGRPPS